MTTTAMVTLRLSGWPPGTVEEKTVEAEVIGALCFHKYANTAYTITHVRTGYRCFFARTKKQARAAIRELLELPVDWSFVDPESVRTWPAAVNTALAHIRAEANA